MAAAAGAEGRPEEGRIAEQLKELEEAWARLQDEMAKRRERLSGSNLAQQYYNDADEAEAWIGEQELYMIADEKPKVRGSLTDSRLEIRSYCLNQSNTRQSVLTTSGAEFINMITRLWFSSIRIICFL